MVSDDNRERAKRHQRRNDATSIRIQTRDIDILDALYRHRVLRQDQLKQLFFNSKERTQKRLRQLYDHRYVDRRFLPERIGGTGRLPNLYVLDRKGADLLQEQGLDTIIWHHSYKTVSDQYLKHALPLNDIIVVMKKACQQKSCEFLEWKTESELKVEPDRVKILNRHNRRAEVTVIPDSYCLIGSDNRSFPMFIEYDGGTQRSRVIKEKVRAYAAYYESGKYHQRYGKNAFRVLFVSRSQRRVADLKLWTESLRLKGQHWFWFATLASLTSDTVLNKPIWWYAGSDERHPLIQLHR